MKKRPSKSLLSFTRRAPRQARSQQRVEAILEAARRLIGERGCDGVSAREIAAEAGVSIASLYQYFPSKTAVLRQLMLNAYEGIAARLAEAYGNLSSPEELLPATERAIDALLAAFEKDEALANIWVGVQANPVLREVDAQDSLRNATFVARLAQPLLPAVEPEALLDACLFGAYVFGYVAGLAATAKPAVRRRLVRELKVTARLRIEALLSAQAARRTA